MHNRTIHVIVDLQFGSTGKGLLAGYIADREEPDTIVTAWGPNAGHTYISREGVKFVNIALPNGIVSPGLKRILLGPGSVINPEQLTEEIERYKILLQGVEIVIHPHAAVVMEVHRELERQKGFKIGSTMKGVGEALINKISRDPDADNTAMNCLPDHLARYLVKAGDYQKILDSGKNVLIEGSQGYSLGINSGFYPYTTSRECTVQQLMVDCGIPMGWFDDFIINGVCRTYPIRVANRFNKDGQQIGTSGPCYPDQREMKWQEIGREAELTTVTKLPRRIFSFSDQQIGEAIRMNDVHNVFVNFVNYYPGKMEAPEFRRICDTVRKAGSLVRWVGLGPNHNDIVEV
jgi:adenylosuccinate synthase